MGTKKGVLSLGAGASGTRMATQHDAVEDVVGRLATDVIHDQDIVLGELRLNAEYGIRDGLGVAAIVPLRYVNTGIRYLDKVGGQEVTLTAPNIHHRDEGLFRLVDPWILGHRGFARGGFTLDIRAGLSLPLGRTEEDPFRLGDMGLAHQHLQFGTGTWNPILGVEMRHRFAGWSVGGYALTQQMLYENNKGYLAGDRYVVGLGAEAALGTDRWRFRLGPELQAETAERWAGVVHTDDGNQGRLDVLGMLGASWQGPVGLSVSGTLRALLFNYVVGGQLEYPAVLELGVAKSFDLLGG